jgi:hypothetical protein
MSQVLIVSVLQGDTNHSTLNESVSQGDTNHSTLNESSIHHLKWNGLCLPVTLTQLILDSFKEEWCVSPCHTDTINT